MVQGWDFSAAIEGGLGEVGLGRAMKAGRSGVQVPKSLQAGEISPSNPVWGTTMQLKAGASPLLHCRCRHGENIDLANYRGQEAHR